jgi:hypothetical protein
VHKQQQQQQQQQQQLRTHETERVNAWWLYVTQRTLRLVQLTGRKMKHNVWNAERE